MSCMETPQACLPAGSDDGLRRLKAVPWLRRMARGAPGIVVAAAAGLVCAEISAWAAHTERVSVDPAGRQGNASSFRAGRSQAGQVAAFSSDASNLVKKDTNGVLDYFVLDRGTGTVERVSVGSSGAQADRSSPGDALTSDGRFAGFSSAASNLVPGDTNGTDDVFLRDRLAAVTERVSLGAGGVEGNDFSVSSALSADGRFVAFNSAASNLVAGDTNGVEDVFVRDRQTATTERVSVDSGGGQANGASFLGGMSADGRFVVFASTASNLVPGDTNGLRDVFIRDRQMGTTERVSVSSLGAEANADSFDASVSADGRFVAFESAASNLVTGDTNGVSDDFVRDRQTGVTERVSVSSVGTEGNAGSLGSTISADGRFVAFGSSASNLVSDDTNGEPDVFVRDRLNGTTSRVSLTTSGGQATGPSFLPQISADGLVIGFHSDAADLVPGDTNAVRDTFLRVGDDDGDGVPVWGGDCNDTNPAVVGGCTCSSVSECDDLNPCTADACVGGTCQNVPMAVAPRRTRLVLRDPDVLRRYAKLSFQGEVVLPHPFNPPLDPTANGLTLEFVNARGQRVSAVLPGGPPWMVVNAAGTRWRYDDPTGAVAGIDRVVVSDESARESGRVRVRARGHGGNYVRGAPLLVRWRVGASEAQCGEVTFLQPDGPMPRCRESSLPGSSVICAQKIPP